jgi:predicted DNA-binding protein (MmcQ/YjbR family)
VRRCKEYTLDIEALRRYCLGFPHATENIQWGSDLCFKVDGKLFAVAPLEVAPVRLSFKCTPENFAELCERPDIIPAPYMARALWVALKSPKAVPDDELRDLLAESYRLVWEQLPRKRLEELAGAVSAKAKRTPALTVSSEKAAKSPKKSKRASTGRRK